MTAARPPRARLFTVLAMAASFAVAAPRAHAQDVNDAVAINTQDGGSVFRLAFSVRHVADSVVDQQNLAAAYASCTECQTVALAFQVVLVMNDAEVVVPVNQAVAYNDQCSECLTFASATQIVIGVGAPMRLTGEGRQHLLELRKRLDDLEGRLDQLTASELVAAVSAVEAELMGILQDELVPIEPANGQPRDEGAPGTSGTDGATTTSTSQSAATTTTVRSTTTTSTGGQATTTSESAATTGSADSAQPETTSTEETTPDSEANDAP